MSRKSAAKKSLHSAITASSRDWGICQHDAWIYGIVVGWGDALKGIARLHNWPDHEVDRLKALRAEYKKLEVKK